MTDRNQTSNPEPEGVRDCNLCSLREALLAVARKNGLVGCITCLEKGNACLRSISFGDAAQNLSMFSRTTWNMCSAGKILCTSVDRRKNYALFGGKGVELNLWDLENCSKIWTAKPVSHYILFYAT
ncbi:unnamed protein product [Musa acuminata subsp. burmannicoides]